MRVSITHTHTPPPAHHLISKVIMTFLQDLDTEEKMRRDESSFSHLQAKDEKEESSQSSSG